MYITEISESDFKKLNLYSYKYAKKCSSYELCSLNEELENEKSSELTTLAIFVHIPKHENINGRELLSSVPFDKFYWNDLCAFQLWDNVTKIRSVKNHWYVDSTAECGRLSKRNIDKIYLIHIGE